MRRYQISKKTKNEVFIAKQDPNYLSSIISTMDKYSAHLASAGDKDVKTNTVAIYDMFNRTYVAPKIHAEIFKIYIKPAKTSYIDQGYKVISKAEPNLYDFIIQELKNYGGKYPNLMRFTCMNMYLMLYHQQQIDLTIINRLFPEQVR